ncbi:MAG: RHS repeat-associated core domain-containing protein [Cryomorphaceae bacterium]|nr:RHS repeat-associated core domain-containing protein [Cryomorphaceae bacterium]
MLLPKSYYQYVGKERDGESGLYYYGARYYADWLYRFVSVNPLKDDYPYYAAYQYDGDKPISYIDLDGLEEGKPSIDGTSIFKLIFGSPEGYKNPRTPLDYMSNHRLESQQRSLLWASILAYKATGGDKLFEKHSDWSKLGIEVKLEENIPDNMVNINPSAIAHNKRINSLNEQFHVSANLNGIEKGFVNLLLEGFLKGVGPENIIYATDGYGSNFLRNSAQVKAALTSFINDGISEGKVGGASIFSSIQNATIEDLKLEDFIGSVDYKITLDGGIITLTMTNVTSLTSGSLGKELDFTSIYWPKGILRDSRPRGMYEYSNTAQTFTLTFSMEEIKNLYMKQDDVKQEE